jgi:hypothetical protein
MTDTSIRTDWNRLNNVLSQAILDRNRLDELLDDLGCDRRGMSYRGKTRLRCPVHEGDGPNMQIDIGGYGLPVRWCCFTQQCHAKWKPSLLGLVRGTLSTRVGREVSMRDAVGYLKGFVGYLPELAPIRRRPRPEPTLLELTREQVRHQLMIPSRYFLERGFSREVLDAFDVGYSPKLERDVVPLYDETGEVCIGYEARSNKPRCDACKRFHWPGEACRSGESKWLGLSGFPKHSYLYNYARAKATTSPFVFLVEGTPDVLRLADAGFIGVALLGSDASEVQLGLLTDLGKEIWVAFDDDDAGRAASERFFKKKVGFRAVSFPVPEPYKDLGETPADELRGQIEDHVNSSRP